METTEDIMKFEFDEGCFDTVSNLQARGHDIRTVELKAAQSSVTAEVCGNKKHGWKAQMTCYCQKAMMDTTKIVSIVGGTDVGRRKTC
jgi:hypothetical protein